MVDLNCIAGFRLAKHLGASVGNMAAVYIRLSDKAICLCVAPRYLAIKKYSYII